MEDKIQNKLNLGDRFELIDKQVINKIKRYIKQEKKFDLIFIK